MLGNTEPEKKPEANVLKDYVLKYPNHRHGGKACAVGESIKVTDAQIERIKLEEENWRKSEDAKKKSSAESKATKH